MKLSSINHIARNIDVFFLLATEFIYHLRRNIIKATSFHKSYTARQAPANMKSALLILLINLVSLSFAKFRYRDNEFEIDSPGIAFDSGTSFNVTASYTVEDFCVTPGQDPDGLIMAGETYMFVRNGKQPPILSLPIGRHRSSQVARWWNERIIPWNNTFDNNTDKLNFALMGTLKIRFQSTIGVPDMSGRTLTFRNIGLAQGHEYVNIFRHVTNYWWFGGPNCRLQNDLRTMNCLGEDEKGQEIKWMFGRDRWNDYSTVRLLGWGADRWTGSEGDIHVEK